MKEKIKIGFWKTGDRNCPLPWPTVGEWDEDEKQIVLEYLKDPKHKWLGYRGSSTCRICNMARNGSCEIIDDKYVWPEGLAHYVDKHNIELPREFIDHVLSRNSAGFIWDLAGVGPKNKPVGI